MATSFFAVQRDGEECQDLREEGEGQGGGEDQARRPARNRCLRRASRWTEKLIGMVPGFTQGVADRGIVDLFGEEDA